MCRLFGLLATPPAPAEPWLVSRERSLLAQSNVSPDNAQADGWGVGWYDSQGSPQTIRGIAGAHEPGERPKFVQAARLTEGPVVLGHLRYASNPMGLPHSTLIGMENSQPFRFGATLFAHNGMIPLPRETRPLLGPFESHLLGVNDSEVLFWLLQRNADDSPSPLAAFGRTVEQLEAVWANHGRRGDGPYSGLNVLYARGPTELWAFCQYRGDHGPSFFDPERPYYELAYRSEAGQVVVGSEPFDSRRAEWRSIPNGHYLHARITGGAIEVETGPIPQTADPPSAGIA